MEIAVGIFIIAGLVFCLLLWAQVIKFDSRRLDLKPKFIKRKEEV